MTDINAWEKHYCKEKSVLIYPDENLVRMLKSFLMDKGGRGELIAVDLGCGSGRHMKLLSEHGIKTVIGMDNSINAINICNNNYTFPLALGENNRLPFKSSSIDIIISWGALHYCMKDYFQASMWEIYEIMKKGGVIFGTLRSVRDTYIRRGRYIGNCTWITDLEDINRATVSLYCERELKKTFKIFSSFQYGHMERTILGDTEKIISHWFFYAEK
ncbi:MAG: methyltransferase domain-containing protein [Spirochaetota bacterium]|nr:methyltransferase domain-containing protein [Spirochaetota bacterium]